MRNRVAILHQGFIPVYRVKFYERLNQIGSTSYVVFHGAPPPGTGHYDVTQPFDFPNIRVHNHVVSILGYRLLYQAVVKQIMSDSYQAVVLGHELKCLSNMVLFGLCKLRGTPVLWWGHGFSKDEIRFFNRPLVTKVVDRLKGWLACAADHYLAYSEGGAERLRQIGMSSQHITVVRNTIDIEDQCILQAEMAKQNVDDIRRRLNLSKESVVLLYLGRLYPEKRVEELLELVRRLNLEGWCQREVEGVIIGDGPEGKALRQLGAAIPGVHFVGAQFDPSVIAQYLRVAAAVVIPGKVGLAVTHAFAHGVPVITRKHRLHAPEVEYLESGLNGLMVAGDFEVFLQTVADYLNSDRRQRMSEVALKTREQLTLSDMVEMFHGAVSVALEEGVVDNG